MLPIRRPPLHDNPTFRYFSHACLTLILFTCHVLEFNQIVIDVGQNAQSVVHFVQNYVDFGQNVTNPEEIVI